MKPCRLHTFLSAVGLCVICAFCAGCAVETVSGYDSRVAAEQAAYTAPEATTPAQSDASPATTAAVSTPAAASGTTVTSLAPAGTTKRTEQSPSGGKTMTASSSVSSQASVQTNASGKPAQTAPSPQVTSAPPAVTTPETTTTVSNTAVVYITITCTEARDNWDALSHRAQNDSVVPEDGVIAARTALTVPKDSTVFAVLKQLCAQNNIPLSYSGNEARRTVYVSGINGLYEKDCGSASGWVYTVGGERIPVGVSGYTVSDGAELVFSYTV
ncbi:MAG: DUF4430 domain-containing protein [Oscillospiraceae bacterium]